jgi:hypothetical protein
MHLGKEGVKLLPRHKKFRISDEAKKNIKTDFHSIPNLLPMPRANNAFNVQAPSEAKF